MFWVIQENLYNEYGYSALMEVIERIKIPHKIVKIVPMFDHFLPEGFDSHSYKGNIDEVPEPEIDDSGLVMRMGSLTLAKIARRRGWTPGSFSNLNFDFGRCLYNWKDNMLNHDACYTHIQYMKKSDVPNTFFIRPSEDTKSFSGMVTTWDEWKKFSDAAGLHHAELVVYGPIKKIYAEWRFFVIDGKIITQSQYKFGSSVIHNALVEPLVINYAQRMIDIWQPARAFVIDIANTADGYKIVEINNFNSAGFYACDVNKIVQSVEEMEF